MAVVGRRTTVAAVRLLFGCVGALLCAGASCGCCFKFPSVVAASERGVASAEDDFGRASGVSRQMSVGRESHFVPSKISRTALKRKEGIPVVAGTSERVRVIAGDASEENAGSGFSRHASNVKASASAKARRHVFEKNAPNKAGVSALRGRRTSVERAASVKSAEGTRNFAEARVSAVAEKRSDFEKPSSEDGVSSPAVAVNAARSEEILTTVGKVRAEGQGERYPAVSVASATVPDERVLRQSSPREPLPASVATDGASGESVVSEKSIPAIDPLPRSDAGGDRGGAPASGVSVEAQSSALLTEPSDPVADERVSETVSSEGGLRSPSVAIEDASEGRSSVGENIPAADALASVDTHGAPPVAGTSVEDKASTFIADSLPQTTSSVLFLLSDLYERFADACVRVRYKLDGKTQVSSGFFVSDRGHVLTPVIGGEDFYVETRSHRQFSAKKRGEDPVSSLCLLQTDEEPLRAVKDESASETRSVSYFSLLHNNGYPKIGQPIVSLSCKLGGSVSPQIGYVTAFQERYFATEFPFVFVRSSLRIDAGDCGGAVLDAQGNLLGMLFHALPDTQETFYMPSQALERVFRDLLLFGNVRYGYAGLSVETAYNPKTHAVCLRVREVRPNSPAAQSGFKVNDVLLRVNDNEVNSMEMFKNFIFLSKPGDVLQCAVMRGKKTLNLTLILAEKP